MDYAAHLSEGDCPIYWNAEEMREIAEARLLGKVFSEKVLDRGLTLHAHVNNMTVVRPSYLGEYIRLGAG